MFDDLGGKLATKAVEVGLDLLFERMGEALRNKSFWQRRRVKQIVQVIGAKFDDLIVDLESCFALREQTSIAQVFYHSGPTRDESWNRLYEVLSILSAWFREWDDMRQAIGSRRTPEILIHQLKSLNVMLNQIGFFVAEGLRKRFDAAPEHDRVTYKAMTDRYNHFLTEYEGLLRRLPQEVGIDPPPFGGEHFFIRL